jgi:hypothetical protein
MPKRGRVLGGGATYYTWTADGEMATKHDGSGWTDGGTYQTSDPTDECYCLLPPDEPVDMQVTASQTAS